MSPILPPRANLEHLKKQAKELLNDFQQNVASATERFAGVGHRPDTPEAQLTDAQHVIAREYGFPSWPKLKAHVEAGEGTTDPRKALVDAVQSGDAARARELFARHPGLRAKINDPAPEVSFGGLPLFPVVQSRNREMIDVFLEAGADINGRSDWWAGSFGVLDSCEPELAPFLIERGARVDAHAAARLGMLDRLDALVVANPAIVHARGGDGQTPLHFAASIDVAAYLLDHGANIDALDVDHEGTPAQWMVSDRPEVARFLVRRGARTDILMAAALGDLDLVRRHLEADPAAIRMRVNREYFPMRHPHAGGHIYTWTLGSNKSAHQIARESGHEELYRFLMDQSSDEVKLAQAAAVGDQAAVDALLAGRPNLARSLSAAERRKLADAAKDNDIDAVRLMLAAGWPVDAGGDHGATALHWAGFQGNAEMAREILRYKPPLDLRSTEHEGTALDWTIHGSSTAGTRTAATIPAPFGPCSMPGPRSRR